MRVQSKIIEDRPSVLARIARFFLGIVEFCTVLDDVYFVFSLLAGLGFLGYLGFVWLSRFLHNGQFFAAAIVGMIIITISLATILRPYLAITLALGVAAVCGVALFSGTGYVFLP
ncbi:hypothetical protein [Iodobacter ciconiae]|uniref:Uncharacterized protein n=1 Tax=Iodobacter ciconiae TaxID=2496266 RepID=A0A3S8ZUN0_9NEIS|nr:hypothetical protein [Iodobacter ciconiae]AZN37168.1 hypothetical protein EJO50_12155 [Iodobacter ciconiae]